MKLKVPFDTRRFFRLEDESMLSLLWLRREDLINIILSSWVLFTQGSTQEIFEVLMDEVAEHLGNASLSVEQLEEAEMVLHSSADQLAELTNLISQELRYVLVDIPQDFLLLAREEGLEKILVVSQINEGDRTLMLDLQLNSL